MLLGVPIMAVIYYIIQNLVGYFLRKRGLAEDTDSYIYLTGVDRQTNELLYEHTGEKKEEKPQRKAVRIKKKK